MKFKNSSQANDNKTATNALTSRRRFTKSIAAALVAAPLAAPSSSDTNAQTPATKQAPAPPNPQPTPAPAAAAQKPSPIAEGYAEVARARFGEKLTPEDLTKIKSDLEGYVRTSERLRAYKLKNGDEPDFIFSA